MTLAPTHQCFDDALDYLSALVIAGRTTLASPEYKLVHALCKAPEGETFAHAWVERGEWVIASFLIDGQLGFMEMPQPIFYGIFNPFDLVKYSLAEATRLNIKHYNFGPWEPRIREGCGGTRIFGSITLGGNNE